MNRKYILGTVLIALLVMAFIYLRGGGRAPAGQRPLENLSARNIGDIKNRFNAAKDDVRVLLLLSPT